MIWTNPVVVSVIVMIALCLLNLNVLLALLFSTLVAGYAAGMSMGDTIGFLIKGMGGNAETALSYVLLGILASAISATGLAQLACKKLSSVIHGRKYFLIMTIAVFTCFSQNLVPIHIAFIPILIPPLLHLFNQLEIDRRGVACALTFGLKAPYIVLPFGFGMIFHTILSAEMGNNGMVIDKTTVWNFTWILGIGMVLGLLIAVFFSYTKPRKYKDLDIAGVSREEIKDTFNFAHLATLVAVFLAFGVQLYTDSLPLGALAALALMTVTGAIRWNDLELSVEGGMKLMGLIAFIMLVAAGYGAVIRETKGVDELVKAVVGMVGGSKVWGAFLMLLIGLLVTMGIGTSFGTIPVVAAIYCPLSVELGFSVGATVCILAAAAALGDAGSPASDSTLGPTSGLDADGQHSHIWDTCVPTFLHYNIPLIIFGMIGALYLF
ncbi:sodium:proton antiporter [Synergistales bacterium]|nr:sodium:proton antiporter [Synergistales bacterium]